MEKMKQTTTDTVEQNIEKIQKLFPNVITETKDDDGNIVKAIDFEKLKQELSKEIVKGEESYDFTWVGKKQAIIDANTPINKTLRPCKAESVNWDKTENIYIEGDNLEVLKILQETYLNKIKMIYIDPPYNTGKDFIYKDNFEIDKEQYEQELNLRDNEGNKQFKENNDSNPRFHSDWCSMLYSRLKISRNLLTDDGVIFISIDNNEIENLRKICDEVFGDINFVGTLIIQTATDNNPTQINTEHEYMLCYAKNIISLPVWSKKSENAYKIISQYEKLKAKYNNSNDIQTELRKWIKKNKSDLQQVEHYNCVDDKGVYTANTNSSNTKPGGYTYDIIHPITKKACPKPDFGWRWTEKTFWDYANNGEVEWGIDDTTQPHIKKRIETAQEQLKTVIYEDGRAATKTLETIFKKKKIFNNPKSHTMIKRILEFVVNSDSIILDFFSGSATTAHAVMQLNAEEEKTGKRKFIMVQLPELTYEIDKNGKEKPTKEGKSAYEAGYRNICEIGKERIRRAGKKIVEETGKTDLDIGFRVFKLDESNMKEVHFSPKDFNQDFLTQLEDNIKEDRNSEDLLFACMLNWGLELSLPHRIEKIDNNEIHIVNENELIACFDKNISENVVKKIADKQPLRVVFRDNSFGKDSDRINVEEIFKLKSPNTKIKVL